MNVKSARKINNVKNFFMFEALQEIFPHINKRILYKILLCIKGRAKKYQFIGISRLECSKFGVSERQMQKIINVMREKELIVLHKRIKIKKSTFLCNTYKITQYCAYELERLKLFVKKIFEYVDPLQYMKLHFEYVCKYGRYRFIINGSRYIINTRGKFKGKLYSCDENKIVNPLLFNV